MSTTTNHWGQSLRAALGRTGHRDKPKRHDVVHRMTYIDNARMAREMGHL